MSTKLSIITINYNNIVGLRKTVESVFAQTCRDFEYIVVDGASTDGSVDVIHEFDSLNAQCSTLNVFTWVSEKDTGIYNAMNKGVRMATGDYVLMLNSGDYFVDEHVVERILPELDGTDIVQGNILYESQSKQLYRNCGYGRSNIDFLDVQRGWFLHQATFSRKQLFDDFGCFDEKYKFVSDTVFYIKTLGYGGCSFKYVNIDVAFFDMTGVSHSTNSVIRNQRGREIYQMQHDLFPGRLYDFCRGVENKVYMYDCFKAHKWSWIMVLIILKLITFIYGKNPTYIIEKANDRKVHVCE